MPTIFLRTDLQMVTWCVLFSTGNKQGGREREGESIKDASKNKKKKVSERKHCVSPGSILIRVQLSSSSPLVPIEIAPINSRPNEKGCWHLLCVREEKKNLLLSFYVGYDGTDQWCPGGDNLFPPFSIYVQTDVYISFYCSGFWVRATSTINPLLCFPPTKANFF